MGRGTDSERPSSVSDPASDTETAMSNMMAEQRVSGRSSVWPECRAWNPDVAGSNPAAQTI